jgi:MFS transporter, UMF1 family
MSAANVATGPTAPIVNDRREIFGWMMYDWANSTFSTTVAGALLSPYLTALAQSAVGENGVVLSLGPLGALTAKSFFPICISVSVFLQVFMLPILGAIADYSHLKKRLMALFCYIGVAATCLLFFITDGLYLLGGLLFIIANLSFGAAIVLYNAFLPDICTEDQTDKVSSRGFAMGYLGGGILLALNFVLLLTRQSLGIDAGLAVRISLLSAGVWWGGFALITFTRLRTRGPARALPPRTSYLTIGFSELGATFRELGRLPQTLKYLIGYLLYNDGIQTVIGLASVFLSQELFTDQQRAAGEDQQFVLMIFLMVQFVAFLGALAFERISAAVGTKVAILISLVLWAGVVVYAYGFLATTTEAWGMAAVIALVLGGSQALSRSLFARMIPPGREASFFGIYEVSERGTSWIGPLIFGVVVGATGSYRNAILSLIVLFIAGMIVLALTDTNRAIREAGNVPPEEVSGADVAAA